MNKKILLFLGIIFSLAFTACGGEETSDNTDAYTEIMIGDKSLSDYEIVYEGKRTKAIAELAQTYIYKTIGVELPIVSINKDSDAPNIHIWIYADRSREGADYNVTDGNIEIEGNANIFVEPKLYEFLNTYMGWMYAGEDNEKRDITSGIINIPENVDSEAQYSAWVNNREATVCLWKPNFSRGTVYNAATSNLTDVLSYSDEQIYEYVRMLKYCGFTGVQMTDMCSAWAGVSGYDYAQQQIRKFADAAHSLNMTFTLWVWAAEFDDFSWADLTVSYEAGEYDHAYENPEVLETFNKYYDIYAELADCSDRVIAHYSDPGNLKESQDIAYFAKLLKDKFEAKNPDIDFGVDCWNDAVELDDLVETLGKDFTLYENSHPDKDAGANLRRAVVEKGCRLGTWSWGTAEMETDQLAQMNFNAEFLQSTYENMLQYEYITHTDYWSEMDAYHVLNVFSLYVAGHLLEEPLGDTDLLTLEVATATVGEENAEKFARVLRLIEMARTGYEDGSFEWNNENYILKSDTYPKEKIISECNELIPFVEKLIDSEIETNTLPLPISLTDLLKLILPHLKQIEKYAEFRTAFDAGIEAFDNSSITLDELQIIINECSEPIPEYNCTIGLWGQIEAREQRILVLEACEKYGLEIPIYANYDELRKYRIYSAFQSAQLGRDYPVLEDTYQYGCAYGSETDRLIDEMVDDGTLTRDADGQVYVTNWKDYIYNFNE